MGLVDIRTKIKSKLDAQTGVDKPLQENYDYHKTGFDGYPAATFEPSNIQSDYETNVENYRTYPFRIVIHQEIESLGRKGGVDIICDVIDTLVQDFEEDWDLAGVVDMVEAIPVEFDIYDEGAGQVMTAEMVLNCKQLISINN